MLDYALAIGDGLIKCKLLDMKCESSWRNSFLWQAILACATECAMAHGSLAGQGGVVQGWM